MSLFQVHLFMPCIIPHLQRMSVPFLDFCSLTLMHSMCAYPHRIPSPPSYVPDEFFPVDVDTFFGRVGNMLVHLIAPHLAVKVGCFRSFFRFLQPLFFFAPLKIAECLPDFYYSSTNILFKRFPIPQCRNQVEK